MKKIDYQLIVDIIDSTGRPAKDNFPLAQNVHFFTDKDHFKIFKSINNQQQSKTAGVIHLPNLCRVNKAWIH